MPNYESETSKRRHLVTKYCQGCGLDIASQGDPVVPWAWQLELPELEFADYNSGHKPRGPTQLSGHADNLLMVGTNTLDFCYCSHLLEDYPQERWDDVLREWSRVLKPGGYLIIMVPDRDLWHAALEKGQPPNDAHRYEPSVGDLTRHANNLGMICIEDRLTNCFPGDYNILGVFQKPLAPIDNPS